MTVLQERLQYYASLPLILVLNTTPVLKKNRGKLKGLFATCKQNPSNRLLRIIKNYRPKGRRKNQVRPLKILAEA